MDEFVNADTIAQGLSAFRPAEVGIAAGSLQATAEITGAKTLWKDVTDRSRVLCRIDQPDLQAV